MWFVASFRVLQEVPWTRKAEGRNTGRSLPRLQRQRRLIRRQFLEVEVIASFGPLEGMCLHRRPSLPSPQSAPYVIA